LTRTYQWIFFKKNYINLLKLIFFICYFNFFLFYKIKKKYKNKYHYGGGLFCCKEILHGRSTNGKGGEEGRASCHILNITIGFTDKIILIVTPSVILSISMPCHCTIFLFVSHCNCVGNYICKNLHVIVLSYFFIHSIPTMIPLVHISMTYLHRCLLMELAMEKFG
jgi:hypothetical protein